MGIYQDVNNQSNIPSTHLNQMNPAVDYHNEFDNFKISNQISIGPTFFKNSLKDLQRQI